MRKNRLLVLFLMLFAVSSLMAGTSTIGGSSGSGIITDTPDPTPSGIQDGSDTLPHVAIVRVQPPPIMVPSAPGQVVRVAPRPVIVGQLCDDSGVCWSAALPYCYDNINDCRETADTTCAGLGGTTSGERLTQCTVDGAVQACCEITCIVNGNPVVGTCTPN